jgi:hypothetical protein
MAYIGKQPIVGNFQVCDAISVVNGQAAYTMQVASTNVEPENANHMLVSLNGILQKPGSSFTISGSTITFASNLATGDVIDFIILLGDVLNIGAPSDDTVATAKVVDSAITTAKINSNAVTAAKLNNDIVSGLTALGATPADTDEFLVSDAGTIKRVDYSYIKGGGITVADRWRTTSVKNASSTSTDEIISAGWGQYTPTGNGTIGSAMSQSSGIFTFPSTGIYRVDLSAYFYSNYDNSNFNQLKIFATTNNSSYGEVSKNAAGTYQDAAVYNGTYTTAHIDVTDTSNVKVAAYMNVDSGARVEYTEMLFTRLGDT